MDCGHAQDASKNPTVSKRTPKASPAELAESELRAIGIHRGEPIRFKKSEDAARWSLGRIHSVERDGSITVHDSNGAARSLKPERIEIQRRNARGRINWLNLSEFLNSERQLTLFAPVVSERRD